MKFNRTASTGYATRAFLSDVVDFLSVYNYRRLKKESRRYVQESFYITSKVRCLMTNACISYHSRRNIRTDLDDLFSSFNENLECLVLCFFENDVLF